MKDREQKASAREYARARLLEWGSCIRSLCLSDAPNPDMYNQQAFYNPRVDLNSQKIMSRKYQGLRWERALETDKVLEPVRDSDKKSWAAVQIRYILRQPGHFKRLPQEEQLEQFKRLTGLGMASYYEKLRRVEEMVAMALK